MNRGKLFRLQRFIRFQYRLRSSKLLFNINIGNPCRGKHYRHLFFEWLFNPQWLNNGNLFGPSLTWQLLKLFKNFRHFRFLRRQLGHNKICFSVRPLVPGSRKHSLEILSTYCLLPHCFICYLLLLPHFSNCTYFFRILLPNNPFPQSRLRFLRNLRKSSPFRHRWYEISGPNFPVLFLRYRFPLELGYKEGKGLLSPVRFKLKNNRPRRHKLLPLGRFHRRRVFKQLK